MRNISWDVLSTAPWHGVGPMCVALMSTVMQCYLQWTIRGACLVHSQDHIIPGKLVRPTAVAYSFCVCTHHRFAALVTVYFEVYQFYMQQISQNIIDDLMRAQGA